MYYSIDSGLVDTELVLKELDDLFNTSLQVIAIALVGYCVPQSLKAQHADKSFPGCRHALTQSWGKSAWLWH